MDEQIGIRKAGVKEIFQTQVQQLTHQQIKGQFIRITLSSIPPFLKKYPWQRIDKIRELPFPKFITGFLASFFP